jgi:hypothetical protein
MTVLLKEPQEVSGVQAVVVEGQLELRVLASRCCLVVVLHLGQLLLTPADVVQLWQCWRFCALRAAHLSLCLEVVYPWRRPRPRDL